MNNINKVRANMNKLSRILIISMGAFMYYGCHQLPKGKKHANWADSTFQSNSTAVDTSESLSEHCFIYTTKADSSFVNFTMVNGRVTGKYSWIPFEKDSRTGTITGLKRGDTLDVVWDFMQEGMRDTLHTMFLLQGNTLKQRPFRVNQQTGRQQTDQHATFSILYKPVACSK